MPTEPYRPSNGTEGEIFMGRFCCRCERDKDMAESGDPEYGIGCPILADALSFKIDDARYPKQWVSDDTGARCTTFVPLGGDIPYRCDRTADMFGG